MITLNLKNATTAIVLVLSLSCASVSATSSQTSFLNHLEPLQNVQYVVTPDQDHQSLIDAFNSAKKSIHVGIFGISSQQIADGLIAAKNRGVTVNIICDSYCTSNPKRSAIIAQLNAAKIKVVTASDGFTISHWKMFVIDEKRAFISTMNFITRSSEMRDMGVFVTNPTIVAEILAVFNSDLNNAANHGNFTPELTQPNLVWSPINSEAKLSALIDSAKTSIEIWIENMGQPTIQKALQAAVGRNVKVRLLTSQCGMSKPPAAAFANLKQLMDLGVEVRGMPFPATVDVPYIHAKTINVDHQTLFLGSENFSSNSINQARELGIIFENAQIQAQMSELYEKDWKVSTLFPAVPLATCSPLAEIDIPLN
ncbi:MAG: hypothetical protein H7328_03465 [Bdellovibrio sp.]|nr:hypothetical protein [Bdellovibrio sp.]